MKPKQTVSIFEAAREFRKLGYEFISAECKRYGTNLFEVRFLGNEMICMTGKEAAAVFYDREKFIRQGAVPKRVQKTLLGENGVQTLDGEEHHRRKAMFMSVMSQQSISSFLGGLANLWIMYIRRWEKKRDVNLFLESQEIFCRAACQWVDVPLDEEEVAERAADLIAMVDAFGAAGPRHWRGRKARARTEEWITNIITDVLEGRAMPRAGSPFEAMIHNLREQGVADKQVIAVEIINLLRPIVAISYYTVFAALALYDHPEQRPHADDKHGIENFIQEVRRFYPFAPFTGARVKETFEWDGYQFNKDALVLLDLYGINHDERVWKEPNLFNPGRFKEWSGDPFDFVPQGGGSYGSGHRCAGEWITIEALKVSMNFLSNYITYKVPVQDLRYSLTRLPTYPTSGFTMTDIIVKDAASPTAIPRFAESDRGGYQL
jgi:fatty-acid peroxygenase